MKLYSILHVRPVSGHSPVAYIRAVHRRTDNRINVTEIHEVASRVSRFRPRSPKTVHEPSSVTPRSAVVDNPDRKYRKPFTIAISR
jgi:hypothetical protein